LAKKRREEKPKEYTRRQLSHFKKQKQRQRIILITGITVIAAIILIPIIGWFVTEYLPLRQTILRVNGVEFNVAYYLDFMKIGRLNDAQSDVSTLANNALQRMMQGETMKQGADKLGITVSDAEIKNYLKNTNLPESKGSMSYFRYQLLAEKLQSNYFGSKVPTEDKQVHALIMMLESDQQALSIRDRVAHGDNFTALAEQYALDYYSKNVNGGDFGWHVRDVLKLALGSDVPLDYAFSAEPGALSPPLSDNETSKQLGYWLIKVMDRPEPGKVVVQALLLSDNVTAEDIKARLEAGTDNLTYLVDKYNQSSLSQNTHGDLGVIDESENSTFTKAFNAYVFNPDTPTGAWSRPILDTEMETRGGSWLVKVIEKDDNRKVSDEDRNYLISQAFSDWFSQLASDPDLKMESNLLTEKIHQWVIDRATKEFPPTQVQSQ
jgi:hypothetical protein